jgi:hypothetical protein
MEINWPIVVIRTKELFHQRLQKKQYWSKNQAYKLFCQAHDDAAFEIADRYAETVHEPESK